MWEEKKYQGIKNITGLTEWYGKNKRLRNLVNLVIVGGFFDPSKSKDMEEMAEIKKMHVLIEKYQLKGQLRWIAAQTDRYRNSELYRYIADTKGAFVQPALYEAFGLTVIKAMNCGLPTFATNQGGPAEIIVDGVSDFHIDPNNGGESSSKIADFFEKCKTDSRYWNRISQGGLKRIYEWYSKSKPPSFRHFDEHIVVSTHSLLWPQTLTDGNDVIFEVGVKVVGGDDAKVHGGDDGLRDRDG
ncbi:sucrose synthase 6 [Perilla frutescens var. hirtella]|uniref:sucrose synthase n=1 Tax=Perilla frutescens var. hirtella TaxID=608512 RepID=A0AAD4PD86_PERFH|nr:sucrose synthase 6 [Perilla frutescens var. hirtella]